MTSKRSFPKETILIDDLTSVKLGGKVYRFYLPKLDWRSKDAQRYLDRFQGSLEGLKDGLNTFFEFLNLGLAYGLIVAEDINSIPELDRLYGEHEARRVEPLTEIELRICLPYAERLARVAAMRLWFHQPIGKPFKHGQQEEEAKKHPDSKD